MKTANIFIIVRPIIFFLVIGVLTTWIIKSSNLDDINRANITNTKYWESISGVIKDVEYKIERVSILTTKYYTIIEMEDGSITVFNEYPKGRIYKGKKVTIYYRIGFRNDLIFRYEK